MLDRVAVCNSGRVKLIKAEDSEEGNEGDSSTHVYVILDFDLTKKGVNLCLLIGGRGKRFHVPLDNATSTELNLRVQPSVHATIEDDIP